MVPMNCYLIYSKDGTCEVVCTRCFLKLGTAEGLDAARELDALHVCPGKAARDELARMFSQHDSSAIWSMSIKSRIRRIFRQWSTLQVRDILIALVSVVSLLYVLPTVVELVAAHSLSPWLAIILPGDVVGCAWLIFGFKMQKTGLILYVLLTVCESCLYAFHVVSANALVWIVDLVPTLVVAGMTLRLRMASKFRLQSPA